MAYPQIIGLTGLARSGKDTAGRFITERYGYQHTSFAWPLKNAVAHLFRVPIEYIMDDKNKDKPMPGWEEWTLREVLQRFGTESMRDTFTQDFWVRRLISDLSPGRAYIVTDVRFDNEAEAIIGRGGVIVRVVRDGAGLTGIAGFHSSEAGVRPDLVHHHLPNSGSLWLLEQRVMQLMRELSK